MAKKRAPAPAAEELQNQQPNQAQETAQQTQGTPETSSEGTDVREGIDIQETPLGGVEGDLAAVDSASGLNLREGPGISYGIAEVLPDNALVAVLELPYGTEVPGWALVHTGQRTGWVDARFIRALERVEVES